MQQSQAQYNPCQRQPPHSKKTVNFSVTGDSAAAAITAPLPSQYKPRSPSVGLVLNQKAARARQAYLKHNIDRESGGKIKLAEGHIIEAKSANALQFFSTHHDYRRGKIRENYIPIFPEGDALFTNATLKPGESFSKAMYEDVVGIYSVDANGDPITIEMITCYEDAGVCEQILTNLKKMGIVQPLPIQCFLIPFLLNYTDKDIVASAPTGSGKTIAVMLPLIELCIRAKKAEHFSGNQRPSHAPYVIIIAPTGSGKTIAVMLPLIELCIRAKKAEHFGWNQRPSHAPYVIIIGATRDLVHQLCLDSLRLANETGVEIKCAYGEYQRDANAQHIRDGCDILISTTGRFVDLVDKQDVLVQYARYFAVDEADKLVTDELIQDLQLVLENRIRPDIVHALFSATFNDNVLSILPKLLQNNFVRVELQTQGISPTVKQRFYNIETFERKEFIVQLLKKKAKKIPTEELPYDVKNFIHPDQYRVPKTIIYGEGRRTIDYLSIYLSMRGIRSVSMHGGRSQTQRNDAWSGFINGKYEVLCASNVAARGINFPDVVLIINFDAPTDFDTYIHRIGRAGRLGFNAKAITFLNPTDTQQMLLASHIVPALRKLGQRIPLFLHSMANFINFGTQDDINVYL
uniref:ATP-dependent RNA helicase n=1 Tax=Panagrolaimus sp. PS1159 TaxID=55785 RepID=A0AC35G6P2_9BILA